MRAFVGDEPSGAVAHVAAFLDDPDPLEGHADLAGQGASAHRDLARRRALPARQKHRHRAGVRPERAGEGGEDRGRRSGELPLQPFGQRRIDHRRNVRAGHRLQRAEQDVDLAADQGRGIEAPADVEHPAARVAEGHLDAAAGESDSREVERQRLGRGGRGDREQVEMAAPERDRAVGEDQRRVVFRDQIAGKWA